MNSSIQTLYDALIAFGIVIGIAGAITLAVVAAGAMFRRDELHAVRAASPASQPDPADDARVPVLR
ncbi:MAG TPA: hypothetical protein VEV45_00195 [Streptosporangiaceae bacterium]|nr:hypothetical protein [Streptosporangiaceae bacterium]